MAISMFLAPQRLRLSAVLQRKSLHTWMLELTAQMQLHYVVSASEADSCIHMASLMASVSAKHLSCSCTCKSPVHTCVICEDIDKLVRSIIS